MHSFYKTTYIIHTYHLIHT